MFSVPLHLSRREEPLDEGFPRQADMFGDVAKDRRDYADAKRLVSRDGDVVLG